MLCLGKVRLPCFYSSALVLCGGLTNWVSTAPLLLDRYLPWHHCQPYLVCNFVLVRCCLGRLTFMASLGSRYDLEDPQS